MDKIYTCEEIAERYQVKLRTVWDWIRSGYLPALQIGRVYRVREADLIRFEDSKYREKVTKSYRENVQTETRPEREVQ